jgi:GDP-L-fucose synthase
MRPYNIGSGYPLTIGQILQSILKATNKNPEIIWDNSKPTTIPFRLASTERLRNEIGFIPKLSFDSGIDKTVSWYKENYLNK